MRPGCLIRAVIGPVIARRSCRNPPGVRMRHCTQSGGKRVVHVLETRTTPVELLDVEALSYVLLAAHLRISAEPFVHQIDRIAMPDSVVRRGDEGHLGLAKIMMDQITPRGRTRLVTVLESEAVDLVALVVACRIST